METYSNAGALEKRFVRDKRQIIEATDLEVAHERTVLKMRILLSSGLDLEHMQTFDFQKLNADQDIISRGTAQTSQSLQALFLATGVHKMAR